MKNKRLFYSKILGVLLIIFGLFLTLTVKEVDSIIEKIIFILLSYGLLYFGLYALFAGLIERNKILSWLFKKLLSIPVLVIFGFNYYTTPILAIIIFLLIFFGPIAYINLFFVNFNLNLAYELGVLYLVSCISVLLFAYKGNWVMERLVLQITKFGFGGNLLRKYSQQVYTRFISYVIMIIIYLFYNFLSFSGIFLEGIFQEIVLRIIMEVFVTFIAIDTVIQIYFKNRNKLRVDSS